MEGAPPAEALSSKAARPTPRRRSGYGDRLLPREGFSSPELPGARVGSLDRLVRFAGFLGVEIADVGAAEGEGLGLELGVHLALAAAGDGVHEGRADDDRSEERRVGKE